MTCLKLDTAKLKHNYKALDKIFQSRSVRWSPVTKLLCGNSKYLKEVLALGHNQICDSRLSNIKVAKRINPDIQAIYIKPPAKNAIAGVVKYADVSLNTSLLTVKRLSEEAKRQNKTHKIIIMVEMGELREGVMQASLPDFYDHIYKLENISVLGIGCNFNCLNGILPSQDKMLKLVRLKELIEERFSTQLDIISGGATISIPLLVNNQIPSQINHFRVGEALFCGTNLFNNRALPGFKTDVFTLEAQIIELYEKPMQPSGKTGQTPTGDKPARTASQSKTAIRAILDIGLLDINPRYLSALDRKINIIGASSDMLVVEITRNNGRYKVGDMITFSAEYMGLLTLMNSRYIEKTTTHTAANTNRCYVADEVTPGSYIQTA